MPIRVKKLIGTFIIVTLVVVYASLAVMIAVAQLAQSPWYVHFVYFLVSGIVWVVPAMFVIRWMAGPVKNKQP